MILPTKHMPFERSLLGVSADILRLTAEPVTVSRLWEEFNQLRGDADTRRIPFDWFILSLDLLYALGAVWYSHGRVNRRWAQ
jgi:hypothetical protein